MPLRWCNCWRSPVPEDDGVEKLLAENEVTAVSFETGEYEVSVPGRTHVSSLPQDDDDKDDDSDSRSSNEGDDGDDENEEDESQAWDQQQPKKHNSAFDEQLKKSITQASEQHREIRRLSSGDSEGSARSDLSHDSYASFHRKKGESSSTSMISVRRSGSQRLFDDEDESENDGSRRWPRRATTTGSDEDEDDTSFRGNAASFMQSRRALDDAKQ